MRQIFTYIVFASFCRNSQRPNKGNAYDRLWKLRILFHKLNEAYAKFYNLSEHLAVDELVVKFKGRVTFRQYNSNKRKHFGTKIYKICDESGYTYDMKVYWGRELHSATHNITATHATVRHLTCRVEGLGYKISMDNFFSSPRIFNDLERCKMNSCRTVQPNRKDMPHDSGLKQLKLKKGDVG